MKLAYKVQPTDLGGTAVPGCGTIHKTEIKDTLTKLSNDLEMPFDFNDYTTGSTGKRDYSGDIDLVVDNWWWGQGIGAFRENLEAVFGEKAVTRHGDMLHLKYEIVGYNRNYDAAKPRTGYVQIDFSFGNYQWEKFYHYSDGESAYKGAHRNLMLSAICAVSNVGIGNTDFKNPVLEIYDGFDRLTNITRWKFGQNGLYRVNRKSIKDRNGVWMRKQLDVVLAGPIMNPDTIAKELLQGDCTEKDLASVETIMAAVKRNFGMTDQEKIWKRTAANYSDWNQGNLFDYPLEISRYFLSKDK